MLVVIGRRGPRRHAFELTVSGDHNYFDPDVSAQNQVASQVEAMQQRT